MRKRNIQKDKRTDNYIEVHITRLTNRKKNRNNTNNEKECTNRQKNFDQEKLTES